uniref:Uncharacterized protein n=1 Tax=Siphoviridae sp. ctM3g2 TaxID=2826255 RepID=A0A8S5LU30_9CAUD|nr:MAG TPA: hypothetical protein [Siphoviridae sp. ctM3g2]
MTAGRLTDLQEHYIKPTKKCQENLEQTCKNLL